MTIQIEQIAQFLDHRDWRYDLQADKNRIMTAVNSDVVEQFVIVIAVQEEGEYLSLFAPELLYLKDHHYKGVAFQTMLAMAWEVTLLRWEYDPSDGEVRSSTGIAVEDGRVTEKQFNRLLSGLIQLTEEGMTRLKQVLATGEDPGRVGVEAQLLAALREMLPEELLGELGAQLQQLSDPET